MKKGTKCYKKWLERFTEIKIRLDTAAGLLNWVKNLVIIVAGTKFIISLGKNTTIILGLFFVVFMYLIGWIALDIIKYPQVEAALRDGKYNPFLKKMDEKISGAHTKKFK